MKQEIQDLIETDALFYPYFLSVNDKLHVQAQAHFNAILSIVLDIFQDEFIADDILTKCNKFIQVRIRETRQILSNQLFLKWLDHLRFRIFQYKQLYIKYEFYEAAHNLNQAFENVFKINVTN